MGLAWPGFISELLSQKTRTTRAPCSANYMDSVHWLGGKIIYCTEWSHLGDENVAKISSQAKVNILMGNVAPGKSSPMSDFEPM